LYVFFSNKGENIQQTPKQIWKEQFLKKKIKRKKAYSKADKPDLFTKHYKDITTKISDINSGYKHNYRQKELNKSRVSKLKAGILPLSFVSVGPYNVGGRTRAIVIDPDDKKTWYTGSATGGVWITTNRGDSWSVLSNDMTNLSVNALAMALSNHDIFYAGTGESFPGGSSSKGNGIWKSIDRGRSWKQLKSTSEDESFSYVNRLWIHPTNAKIVLAATNLGIYKSVDEGSTWKKTYESSTRVEDFASYKLSIDTLYAGVNELGVIRSTDAGDTWSFLSAGLSGGRRFEIAVSQVNRNVVYASVDENKAMSSLYVSKDKALSWIKFNTEENLLGGQGEYDNCVEGHPFDDNIVFVGGVNLWKIKLDDNIEYENKVLGLTNEKASFLKFVDFNAEYYNGKLSVEGGLSLNASDWSSVEIRFGNSIKQKAHRFIVPAGATAGVKDDYYEYADYVDVPFQVWDTKNNRQLMVSFRDQEKDGSFNLYPTTGKDYAQLGREYIYISAVKYEENKPNANIMKTGGHRYKNMYMLWPQLDPKFNWEELDFPDSKICINYGKFGTCTGDLLCIADAYGDKSNLNVYDQGAGFGRYRIPGLHPDHHNISIIPGENKEFTIVNANDGGIGVSFDSGVSFTQKPMNYVTTQFYGVAKNPNKNQYIGGMQDNGTWMSSQSIVNDKNYTFQLGGDGFECLWHADDENKILGSVYYNAIKRSSNGGVTWAPVRGIAKEDGPFITRLASSKKHPDVVFAIAKKGLYKSVDFGANWDLKSDDDLWDYASSEHNVCVSIANPKVVWAGQQMSISNGSNIYVSKDEGDTFSRIGDYKKLDIDSRLSGISTHPTNENIAYLLFSTAKSPKILRTVDCGISWTDISGFNENKISDNGFPDVVVHSLLVMPYNTNIIWVGTEIGIFESIDRGVSWHKLKANFPDVSVYQLKLYANQVVIATHGRGIWTYDVDLYPEILNLRESKAYLIDFDANIKYKCDSLEVVINDNISNVLYNVTPGRKQMQFNLKEAGETSIYLKSYINGFVYPSKKYNLKVNDISPVINNIEEIKHLHISLDLKMKANYDSLFVLLNNKIERKYKDITKDEIKVDLPVDEIGDKRIYLIAFMSGVAIQSGEYTFSVKEKKPIIEKLSLIDKHLLDIEYFIDYKYSKIELYVNNKLIEKIDNPIEGQGYLQLDYPSNEEVILKIIAFSGDYSFSSIEYTSSILTNINNKSISKIQIYPNPCSDYVKIAVTDGYSEFNLDVLDLYGRKVLSEKFYNGGIKTVDLSSLPKGVYLFSITNKDEKYISKVKLVK